MAGENNKDLDQWNLEQEHSRPGDSMSRGTEAEIIKSQVENREWFRLTINEGTHRET